ncbi:MAG: class I SAM-dependent methyltransferase [Bacteroidota bacterium]
MMMTKRALFEHAKQHSSANTAASLDATGFEMLVQYLHAGIAQGSISEDALGSFRSLLGPALSSSTMQGIAYEKPYGYAGDFWTLDLIYQNHHNTSPEFYRWDAFFQNCSAVRAVRNRKQLFKHLMLQLEAVTTGAVSVLNLASGPGRDVLEYFQSSVHPRCSICCVDQDQHAIAYAQKLCGDFREHIRFEQSNAFRFRSAEAYRLIWSAGLFDYLNDNQFVFLLNRLLDMLAPDGEVIIGNFSPANPSRAYMEVIGDWHLIHRSADQLVQLSQACSIDPQHVRVLAEPEGVNLFLHIKAGAGFLDVDAQFGKTVYPTESSNV